MLAGLTGLYRHWPPEGAYPRRPGRETGGAQAPHYEGLVLRFVTGLAVTEFTNNEAERSVRPVKVQQHASDGCWRTLDGLAEFAIVQSYLPTAAKWGIRPLDALLRAAPAVHHRAMAPDRAHARRRCTQPSLHRTARSACAPAAPRAWTVTGMRRMSALPLPQPSGRRMPDFYLAPAELHPQQIAGKRAVYVGGAVAWAADPQTATYLRGSGGRA